MTTIDQVRELIKKVGGASAAGGYAVWSSQNIMGCFLDSSTTPKILGPSEATFDIRGSGSGGSEDVTKKQQETEGEPKEVCLFCSSAEHVSTDCDVFWNAKQRRKQISAKKLCLKCLQPKDSESHVICPWENRECSLCSSSSRKHFHHSVLCNVYTRDMPE